MQSGNRKLHSTESSLLYSTDELRNKMDHKKMSVIVLLDMSKAFYSIRHDLMLRKLCNAGVSELACAWFESYLSQRQQVVKIQDTLSSPVPLTVGVRQGSILGPVLFILYVNDLFRVPKHCKPLGYVDDTKIFLGFLSNKLHDVVSAVNEDLKEILSWCCRNLLLINPDKTKLLYVGVPQLMRTLPPTLPSTTSPLPSRAPALGKRKLTLLPGISLVNFRTLFKSFTEIVRSQIVHAFVNHN